MAVSLAGESTKPIRALWEGLTMKTSASCARAREITEQEKLPQKWGQACMDSMQLNLT